jgi:hypothetical protein
MSWSGFPVRARLLLERRAQLIPTHARRNLRKVLFPCPGSFSHESQFAPADLDTATRGKKCLKSHPDTVTVKFSKPDETYLSA